MCERSLSPSPTHTHKHTQREGISFPALPPTLPEASTMVGVESWVKFCCLFLCFSASSSVKDSSRCCNFLIHMKQKKTNSPSLLGLMLLSLCDVLLLLWMCCWTTGTFRPGGSITWQKPVCVFALSVDHVVKFYVWRGTIVLWVYHHSVCVRAGHTVCHVSLIRLSLARPWLLPPSGDVQLNKDAILHQQKTPQTFPSAPPDSIPSSSWLPCHSVGTELDQSLRNIWFIYIYIST